MLPRSRRRRRESSSRNFCLSCRSVSWCHADPRSLRRGFLTDAAIHASFCHVLGTLSVSAASESPPLSCISTGSSGDRYMSNALSPTWVLDGRPSMISGTPRCHGSGWEEACDAYRLAAARMAPVNVVLPVFNPPPVFLFAPKLRRSMARNMASNRANRSSTETEPRLHYSDHATKSMGCMKPQMPVGTFSSLVS